MTDKERTAFKRLVKKLSAMRATLSKDERNLLDKLILGEEVAAHQMTTGSVKAIKAVKGEADVAAHQMTTGSVKAIKAVKGGAEVAAHQMTTGSVKAIKAVKGAAEVAAHQMTTGSVKAIKAVKGEADVAAHQMTTGSVKAIKAVKGGAEVAAHQMTGAIKPRRATKATQVQAAALNQQLEFDPTTGGYKVTEAISA